MKTLPHLAIRNDGLFELRSGERLVYVYDDITAAGEGLLDAAASLLAPPTPPLTPERAPLRDVDEFYLLDTRTVVGNCAMFWAPDGKGYTCELSKAGLYSRDDAPSHRETDVPVPRALAEEMAVTHVRLDQLRERLAIRDYEKTKSRTERKAWLDKHCPTTPRSR